MGTLRDLQLRIHYEGSSQEILREFVLPGLSVADWYDRLTGYFTVSSLVALAEGVESLWRRGGRMRLVIGIHDIPDELRIAASDDRWVEALIAAVRERLMRDIAGLADEFARDRLGTLGWMLRDGLLKVRVAAPVSLEAAEAVRGIFHVKRLLMGDAGGNAVGAVGSANETLAGLAGNYEELMVHMSWRGSSEYVSELQESFERIWQGSRPGLTVRELDEGFAAELLAVTQRTPATQTTTASTYGRLLEAIRHIPSMGFGNLSRALLFPHQERAIAEALDRWPVRALLADEVGLGKTLEGGAVINQMVRSGAAKRVVILAPKNVTRQWRDEMALHFGLDFWLYESSGRVFQSASGDLRALPRGASPAGSHAPGLSIISAQLARGSGGDADIFTTADVLPDMLVVDEAHAARVRREIDGFYRPTRLWKTLDRLADRVPHLVFLTATPLQLDWIEYFSLLRLLGLPEEWDDAAYERSLAVLAATQTPTLKGVGDAVQLLRAADRTYGREVDPGSATTPVLTHALAAQRDWPSFHRDFIARHPANRLTIRNSRSALERLGYRFPSRVFEAPSLEIPPQVKHFYAALETYLEQAFMQVETILAEERHFNPGFAKSSYRQRMASSLTAARLSLARRQKKLDAIGSRQAWETTETEEADDDAAVQMPTSLPPSVEGRLANALAVERMYLRDLSQILEHIRLEAIDDPKLAELDRLLARVLVEDRVLVFSRYTDTVDACVARFKASPVAGSVGHGIYTGSGAWIDTGSGLVQTSKDGIRKALETGLISVLFCSDAASEGLNLQAARVIINVDVPWNPARLEQRIGRVARLGQAAAEVLVVNLWFPTSVEARMYGRLLERKDLYELAVGSLPDLVSDAIAREVMEDGDEASDAIEELQQVRESLQIRAISRLWEGQLTTVARPQDLTIELAEILRAAAETWEDLGGGRIRLSLPGGTRFELATAPGRLDALTVHHPALEHLVPRDSTGAMAPISLVESREMMVGLSLTVEGRLLLIDPSRYVDVLAAALGARPLQVPKVTQWHDQAEFHHDLAEQLSHSLPPLPPTGRQTIPRPSGFAPPERDARLVLRPVGEIRVLYAGTAP